MLRIEAAGLKGKRKKSSTGVRLYYIKIYKKGS